MYNVSNQENPITQQEIQRDKENYIANRIIRLLISEECLNKGECEKILKIVENRVIY
jgi:hypothetical protein